MRHQILCLSMLVSDDCVFQEQYVFRIEHIRILFVSFSAKLLLCYSLLADEVTV